MIPTRDDAQQLDSYFAGKWNRWANSSRREDFRMYTRSLAMVHVALRGKTPLHSAAWMDADQGDDSYESNYDLRLLTSDNWVLVNFVEKQPLPRVEVVPRSAIQRVSVHETRLVFDTRAEGRTSFTLHFDDRDLLFDERDKRFQWGDQEAILQESLDDFEIGMQA